MNGTQTGTREVRTLDLRPGDAVVVDAVHGFVRHVHEVRASGYLNYRNEPIYNVYYVEPGEPGVWSGANCSHGAGLWTVLDADDDACTAHLHDVSVCGDTSWRLGVDGWPLCRTHHDRERALIALASA